MFYKKKHIFDVTQTEVIFINRSSYICHSFVDIAVKILIDLKGNIFQQFLTKILNIIRSSLMR